MLPQRIYLPQKNLTMVTTLAMVDRDEVTDDSDTFVSVLMVLKHLVEMNGLVDDVISEEGHVEVLLTLLE